MAAPTEVAAVLVEITHVAAAELQEHVTLVIAVISLDLYHLHGMMTSEMEEIPEEILKEIPEETTVEKPVAVRKKNHKKYSLYTKLPQTVNADSLGQFL